MGDTHPDLNPRTEGTATVEASEPPFHVPRIGPYKVLRSLGQGGMGAVFLAVRDDEQYQKRVAVKVLKAALPGEDAVKHFRRERQILATLDHPNIATLLDGGTSEAGLPYIVMEHVEGLPIDRYCDAHGLGMVERLKLFRTVCSALQYAHRNLVVHRDVKPGNVLVTNDGVPKLLDFGVAKLLNPTLYVDVQTATGVALTPAYASPEQARGEPVTTATDVYSLGVLLYELLTGRRPYQPRSPHTLDLLRAICEDQPERPSLAVLRTAQETASVPRTADGSAVTVPGGPHKLSRRLRGDLDNVLMMALRKEPSRRYASVEAFSEDVARYLDGRPVTARKATFSYRARKFVSRNAAAVASAVALAILIVALAVTSSVQAARIARERDQTARERDRAERVSQFMVSLFKASRPSEAQGRVVTAREVLDKGAARISTELADQPDVRAALLHTLGDVYMALGVNDKAGALLEEALQERRQLYRGDHRDLATTLSTLGLLRDVKGDIPGAEALYREGLEMRRRLFGDGDPNVAHSLNALASLLNEKGDHDGAERLHRQALAIWQRSYGPEDQRTLASINNLGTVLLAKGKLEEAERLFRDLLAVRRRGGERPGLAVALENLGNVLYERGQYAEAESLLRESEAMMKRLLGNIQDRRIAVKQLLLGAVLVATRRPAEAETVLREARATLVSALSEEHGDVAETDSVLGAALAQQGRFAESERVLLKSHAVVAAGGPGRALALRRTRERLVQLYEAWGRPEQAEPYR